MRLTIERVSSPWILLSIPLFVAGVSLAPRSTGFHIALGLIGGFTLFCLAVVIPLYSSLVGGRPRGLGEWGLALGSYTTALISMLSGMAGLDPRPALALSMAFALAFTLAQLRSSKVPLPRLYTLPTPFILGLASLLVGNQFWSLLAYGAWFSTTLVMVVGAVFLQNLYHRPGTRLHFVSILIASLGLALYGIYSREVGLRLLALSLILHVMVMRPWEGVGGKRIGSDRGHLAQALGALATLAASIIGVDDVSIAHMAMLGFAATGVYTQAPLLSPMIVSATWRRKKWLGLSPLLMLGAALARVSSPHLSQALVIASVAVLLLELNPSPRRLYYIVRYGGEEGYLRSYYDAVKPT
ncbi:MAG: hypothetical protein F7B18_00655 [Desulfurococcales archaeon]|nr:hypothetical protein [Desulfurococcales archaeon]